MSAIDIILTFVLFGSMAYGVWQGLIRQVVSLAGIVLGVVGVRVLGPEAASIAARIFPSWLHSPQAAAVVGNTGVFAAVWLAVAAASTVLHKASHMMMLGWVDHLAGGVFSLFKWLTVLSALLNLWHTISPDSALFATSTLMDGEMLPWVMKLAPKLFGIVGEWPDIAPE